MQPMSSFARFLLVFPLALTLLSPPAAAAFGTWAEGQQARARLLAAGIGPDGRLGAAIEIELEPGWKTYWRTPGDAGIPPKIDFGASANAGAAAVVVPGSGAGRRRLCRHQHL